MTTMSVHNYSINYNVTKQMESSDQAINNQLVIKSMHSFVNQY